ncbi:hypothetical protein PQX77_012159 [Marasmius sp. AFHP31]|nr:hypothetical protein PQX77_012159 [Marasmius sp. AFHP31]
MPRPKQYFTREEKLEAKRKASARHYEKHKEDIAFRRKIKRRSVPYVSNFLTTILPIYRYNSEEKHQKKLRRLKRKGENVGLEKNLPLNNHNRATAITLRKKSPKLPIDTPQSWAAKARKLAAKIDRIYGESKSYKMFLKTVITQFIEDANLERIDRLHTQFEGYCTDFDKYRLATIQCGGSQAEAEVIANLRADTWLTLSGLTDIFGEAAMGVERLALHSRKGCFGFQRG